MNRPAALALLSLLAACGQAGGNETAQAGNSLPRTRGVPAEVEIPAPALPTDEQLANALDAEASRQNMNLPDDVIVEPDMMRAVVRDARCAFAAGSRSRAVCSFEHNRSPMERDHEAAVAWVARLHDWRRVTRTFAFMRQACCRAEPGWWHVLPGEA
jgi:hypothetical protein